MVTFKKHHDKALMQMNSTSVCLKKGLKEISKLFKLTWSYLQSAIELYSSLTYLLREGRDF